MLGSVPPGFPPRSIVLHRPRTFFQTLKYRCFWKPRHGLSLHLNSVLRSFKPFLKHNHFFAGIISYIKVCLGSGRRAYLHSAVVKERHEEYPTYIYICILGGHGGNLVRARTWPPTLKDATTRLLLLVLFDEVYRLSSVHIVGGFKRAVGRRCVYVLQPKRKHTPGFNL
jgi:hypothetical protein